MLNKLLKPKIITQELNLFYSNRQILHNIELAIASNQVTALIGPSGCGKSSFLRCINRMNDLIDNSLVTGKLEIDGQNIYDASVDIVKLRTNVGMVFQKPNPFFKSIYDNIAYAPKIHQIASSKQELNQIVEHSLQKAGLFNEVKDRLHSPAISLSGGQQQRLCIARAIAIKPEIILMDEPCSALDPIATARVEELIDELKINFTIIIVTHSMQQAARISDYTAFFDCGKIEEYDQTKNIFTNPNSPKTQDYITGRFG